MHHDSQAYWLRMGDSWTNIDYKKTAKEWMKPLEKGEVTGMVEIPANWDVSLPMLQDFAIQLAAGSPELCKRRDSPQKMAIAREADYSWTISRL